jgi:septal ring-binding cell division protein DamX
MNKNKLLQDVAANLIELAGSIKNLASIEKNEEAEEDKQNINANSEHMETEPTPVEPVLSLEALRAVLADKSRKGYTTEIRSLLQKYGASRLSGIDPANYKALIADVEGLTDAT